MRGATRKWVAALGRMEGHHPRRHDNVGGYLTTSPPGPPSLPPSLPLSDVDFLIPSEIDHAYIYIEREFIPCCSISFLSGNNGILLTSHNIS